ncbi:MAG: DUF4129 domain-containing protein [Bryobacteraceae bacterium]
MAGPVKATGAIEALEETFHLLRRAPANAIAAYLAGSVPFLIAFLFFWAEMSGSRSADSSCLGEALLLAVLFVWMNCCKAVFAGRLRRELEGVPEPAWSLRRAVRIVAIQGSVQPWKLVILPAAALAVLPSAWATAFFRNTAVFADAPGEPHGEAVSQARRYASAAMIESWMGIGVLHLLWLVVLVNIAVTLALLPALVKILTGYENQFSRSGLQFILNSTFWATAVGMTWLAMDPVFQAFFTLRCFVTRSMKTGDDLRAALRGLAKAGALVAVALALLAVPKCLAEPVAAPTPGISDRALERSIATVLARREYQWRLPRPASPDTAFGSAVLRFTERIVEWVKQAWRTVAEWLGRLFEWLRNLFHLSPAPNASPPSGAVETWMWILAALAAVAIVALLVLHRPRKPQPTAAPRAAIDLADERTIASQLPEESWLAMAEEWIGRQDLRMALRALYLGTLAYLSGRELLAIHACKSNREYDAELRRKSRATPEVWPPFHDNVASFERSWYGTHEVTLEHIAGFRANLERIRMAAASPGAPQ